MILVDVYIPAVEQTYDFRLEQDCFPDVIIGEISEMVEQKEQMPAEDTSALVLFDADTRQMLPFDRTLLEGGVTDGHLLILA